MPSLCCHAEACRERRSLRDPVSLAELSSSSDCGKCALWFCQKHFHWPSQNPEAHRRLCREVTVPPAISLELCQVDYLPKPVSVGLRTRTAIPADELVLNEDPLVCCPARYETPEKPVAHFYVALDHYYSLKRAKEEPTDPFHHAAVTHGRADDVESLMTRHLASLLARDLEASKFCFSHGFSSEMDEGFSGTAEDSSLLLPLVRDRCFAVPSLHFYERSAEYLSLFHILARLNHSHRPNVRLVSLGPRAALISLGPIPCGTELTVDYDQIFATIDAHETGENGSFRSKFSRRSRDGPNRERRRVWLPMSARPFDCRCEVCSSDGQANPEPLLKPLPDARDRIRLLLYHFSLGYARLLDKREKPLALRRCSAEAREYANSVLRRYPDNPDGHTLALREIWYNRLDALLAEDETYRKNLPNLSFDGVPIQRRLFGTLALHQSILLSQILVRPLGSIGFWISPDLCKLCPSCSKFGEKCSCWEAPFDGASLEHFTSLLDILWTYRSWSGHVELAQKQGGPPHTRLADDPIVRGAVHAFCLNLSRLGWCRQYPPELSFFTLNCPRYQTVLREISAVLRVFLATSRE